MNLDLILFSAFLMVSLILGLISSTKVHNISEYAIGNRDFSTATLVATMVATWVGAGFFSNTLSETYRQGIYYLIPASVNSLVLILIGYVFGPRMGEFLGKLSIAQSMGEIFGPKVRVITVIFSLLRSICYLGIQFKVSSKILELIFGASGEYATIFSALIVLIYSTLGGIRSVTFTDVIQFFTFGCLMPIIAIIAWQALGEASSMRVWHTITTNPIFDWRVVFDFDNPKFYEMLAMCVVFIIPEFQPAIFQRISMGSSVGQVVKSFKIAGLLCLLVQCVAIGLAILVYSDNPNINPDDLVRYIINHYTHYIGFKGMIAIGIMAMLMSSSDSLINSISIIFAHDLCKSLGFKWAKNELLVARIAAIISGVAAIFVALRVDSVLNLMLSFTGLYVPAVSIPFILAIFGFRSSEKSVLSAMSGSLITILLWKTFFAKSAIDSFIPSVIASVTFLFGTHYLTKQPGGWIKTKSYSLKSRGPFSIEQFANLIRNFDFAKFMEKNSPNNQLMYIYTGFFCFLSFYLNLITVSYNQKIFCDFFKFTTPTVLFMATSLFIYPLWPKYLKNNQAIPHIVWNVFAFYSLIFTSFMFAIVGNFAPPQVMILIVNLIVISILVRWQWALTMILFGMFVTWKFTNIYFVQLISSSQISLKLQMTYVLLLMSSLVLIFLKPKQEGKTLLTERVKHLKSKVLSYEGAMLQILSSNSKNNNIQEYYKNPQTVAISDMFFDFYDDLNDSEKEEAARLVLKSVMRLENFESNIANLNALARDDVTLKREEIDFTNLIQERLALCRKLYEEDESPREFILNISENVRIIGDRSYFEQMVDNLIINAITYCTSNSIAIHLERLGTSSMRLYVRI